MNIMDAGDSFFALRDFARGKINKWKLMESEPLIGGVLWDDKNPAKSVVDIDFDNSNDFFEHINVSDDDAWFARAVDSYQEGFEFYDDYSTRDDFQTGYGPWYEFDEENQELLEKISRFIYPHEFDLNSDSFKTGLAKALIRYFPKQVDEIMYDYVAERNSEMNQEARKSIKAEVRDYVESKGFELVPYQTLQTTIGNLISLFLQYNVPHESLGNLIKKIFWDSDKTIGGWDENKYEYGNSEFFDSESFNKTVNRNLEFIYDKILEEFDAETRGSFLKTIDRVSNKFNLNVNYDLPKDKSVTFRIKGFNMDKQKIKVILRKALKQRELELSEENFYHLLYQPELFNFGEL